MEGDNIPCECIIIIIIDWESMNIASYLLFKHKYNAVVASIACRTDACHCITAGMRHNHIAWHSL